MAGYEGLLLLAIYRRGVWRILVFWEPLGILVASLAEDPFIKVD